MPYNLEQMKYNILALSSEGDMIMNNKYIYEVGKQMCQNKYACIFFSRLVYNQGIGPSMRHKSYDQQYHNPFHVIALSVTIAYASGNNLHATNSKNCLASLQVATTQDCI
jgi:hypothetical protein